VATTGRARPLELFLALALLTAVVFSGAVLSQACDPQPLPAASTSRRCR
jgi:hypothetical protein